MALPYNNLLQKCELAFNSIKIAEDHARNVHMTKYSLKCGSVVKTK